MKKALLMFGACCALAAHAVQMATQPWVTNRIEQAEARTDAKILAATNYADRALGMFAATGAVTRVSDGTNTIDASGSVYAAAATTTAWTFTSPVAEMSVIEPIRYYADDSSIASWVVWRGAGWYCFVQYEGAEYTTSFSAFMAGEEDSDRLEDVVDEIYFTRRVAGKMYPVGKLALTNDIPDVSGYATPADVTAAIREQSLGGIWDVELGVWWTPVMSNGALTYQATTNINLSAEGNR